ncbi:MAG: Holliday junction resolvase RuvX [Verrucomicrobia bacterium]|nr:Holliday junction resolvase RuvX [Verrucomicrobiota bacterium]
MERALGIDFGEVRIGLAISDGLGLFARPLETIHVTETEPLARIAAVVRAHDIRIVVLGLPLRLDGSEGTATRKVRTFARELAPVLPEGVSIMESDERLSTVTAREKRAESAGKRRGKGEPPPIDQVAAAVILQDYLDARRPPEPWPEEEP